MSSMDLLFAKPRKKAGEQVDCLAVLVPPRGFAKAGERGLGVAPGRLSHRHRGRRREGGLAGSLQPSPALGTWAFVGTSALGKVCAAKGESEEGGVGGESQAVPGVQRAHRRHQRRPEPVVCLRGRGRAPVGEGGGEGGGLAVLLGHARGHLETRGADPAPPRSLVIGLIGQEKAVPAAFSRAKQALQGPLPAKWVQVGEPERGALGTRALEKVRFLEVRAPSPRRRVAGRVADGHLYPNRKEKVIEENKITSGNGRSNKRAHERTSE